MHIKNVEDKCKKVLNIMRCLAGMEWRADFNLLKYIHCPNKIKIRLWELGIWISSEICNIKAGHNTGPGTMIMFRSNENITSVFASG